MAGPKPTTPKPATVRVLHRAVDSDDDSSTPRGSGSSPQQSVQELKAQADSLKQRLEQVCVCVDVLGCLCAGMGCSKKLREADAHMQQQ